MITHSYLCEPSSIRYFLISQNPSDKNSHRPQRQFQVKPGVGKHLRLTVTRYESLKGRMFCGNEVLFFWEELGSFFNFLFWHHAHKKEVLLALQTYWMISS